MSDLTFFQRKVWWSKASPFGFLLASATQTYCIRAVGLKGEVVTRQRDMFKNCVKNEDWSTFKIRMNFPPKMAKSETCCWDEYS